MKTLLNRSISFTIAFVMMIGTCMFELGAAQNHSVAVAEGSSTSSAMPQYKHIKYDYRKGLGEEVTDMNMTDQLSFDYSDDMWFSGTKVADAEEMNADIIKLAVALACSAYYDYEAPIRERTIRIDRLFTQMGFHCKLSDIDTHDLALDDYNVDIPTLDDCNTAGYYIGHKEIEHHGEKYILYAVPIKGTSADLEWFANMRLGPGKDHKGFYDAAETVYDALDDVVAKTGSEYDKDHRIFLFTGHSRGAAVANIVAGKLSVEEKLAPRNQIFAYTFACPAVSKRADDSLMNIFNFNNPLDLVPMLPMEDWGYKRFGQTITLQAEGTPYENMLQQYQRVTETKYKGELDVSMRPESILNSAKEESMRYLTSENEETALFFYNKLIYPLLLESNQIYSKEDIKNYIKRINKEDQYEANNDNADFIEQINQAEKLDEYTNDHLSKCSSYRDELKRFREEILNTEDNADAIAKVLEDRKSVSKLIYSFLLMPNPFDKLGLDKMIREKIVSEIDKALSRIDGYENLLDIVKVAKNVINYACGAPNAHCMVTYVHWINSLFCGGDGWREYDRLEYNDNQPERNTFDIKNQEFVAKPSGRKFHPGCGSYISPKCFVDAGLRKIVFPENMNIQIGEEAFFGSKLYEVDLPDNIKRIGKTAFGCSAVNKVTIGDAEYYGKGMFEDCGSLKELSLEKADLTPNLDDDNAAKCPVDLLRIYSVDMYRYDTEKRVEKITIRTGTSIPSEAFASMGNLRNVELPDTIKTIGNSAFSYCSSLSEFELPKSIEYIGDKAFYYCQRLPDISFGNNLKHIGDSAFTDCSSLTDVTLPDHMDYIGASAFYNCSDLISAKIGTVDWIGRSVFKGCNALKNLTLADTHLTPKSIKEDDYHADVPGDLLFGRDNNGDYTSTESLETITITHDTDIAPESFANLHAKKINLPKETKTIGEDAFSGSDLQKLNWDKLTSLEVIGDRAFSDCMSINEEIILPESVNQIGEASFSNCRNLPAIVLGTNLRTIGGCAFQYVPIKKITVPESVTSIGRCAFVCGDLEDIYIMNPDCDIYDDELTISKNYYSNTSGTIYGYDNSTAQAYAEKYKKNFVSLGSQPTTETEKPTSGSTENTTSTLKLAKGDANGDNSIDMSDVVIVMQACLNPKKYGVNGTSPDRITPEGEIAGDVDGNKGLSANDALLIQKFALKLIDTL